MINNIIFDFDGVLADSLDCVLKISNGISQENGGPQLSRADVRQVGLTGIVQASRLLSWKLPFFLNKLRKGISRELAAIPIHPEMAAAVRTLSEDFDLGIVTSNSRSNVDGFLAAHELTPYFSYVLAEISFFNKSRSVLGLLDDRNMRKAQSVYVGDEVRDIRAMKKIGLPIVAVTWGYDGEHLLRELEPDYLATSPFEMMAMARSWVAAREPQPNLVVTQEVG